MRLFTVICLVACLLIDSFASNGKKTITRVDDPAVMECGDFKALFGAPIDELALMVVKGDAWEPIPFQIDQKKPDGNYAYTTGPEASEDPDPNIDLNDELVFMVKDTGDRAAGEKWPEGVEAVMEIEVTDPKNGQKGWLYLARFTGPAPRSDVDYIRVEIDEVKGYRRAISYEYVVGGPIDRVYPDFMAARILPNGREGLDVLDRLKIRGKIILPGGISIPVKADEMIKSRDKAYIDGPVRILHLADGYLEFGGIKFRGTGYSTLSYYVNHVICPVTMQASSNLARFLIKTIPEIRINGFMDFNSNVYGSYMFSAANPYNREVILNGRMSAAEKNLDTQTPIEWIAGFGPQGAVVSRLVLPKETGSGIKKYTYYMDDNTINDPPEDNPGLTGVGFSVKGTSRQDQILTAGTMFIYIYFKKELKPDDVGDILDIIDHPVTVTVKQVK